MIASSQFFEIFKNWLKHAGTVNNFACHRLKKDFYHQNNLNQTVDVFPAFSSAFVVCAAIFFSKSELSMNPEIADLLTFFLLSLHYVFHL